MIKRFLAILIVIVAAVLLIIFFFPGVVIWLITGRDLINPYMDRTGDIFSHLVKK